MNIEKRNIVLYIILTICTCGIFGLYWFVCLTDDSKKASNDWTSASGGVSLLLTIVTCNIYGLYWAYKLGERLDYAANSRGIGDGSSNNKILFLVLQLFGFGIITYAIAQDMLNKISDNDMYNGGANGFGPGGQFNATPNNGPYNGPVNNNPYNGPVNNNPYNNGPVNNGPYNGPTNNQ